MDDNNIASTNAEVTGKHEEYAKYFKLLTTNQGDPKLLQGISENTLREYADFLTKLKTYQNKIKKGEKVTEENRREFRSFLENKNWMDMNINNKDIEVDIARFNNMKDIAYHKYLWMTRGRMQEYTYTLDREKNFAGFQADKRKSIKNTNGQDNDNVFIGDIYLNNVLDGGLNLESNDHGNGFYEMTNLNGLVSYLNKTKKIIESILKDKSTRKSRSLKIFLLELKYMLEVADATHNMDNKKILSETIMACESAIETLQNESFEEMEKKRKEEMEINAIVAYCKKNNLKLDDVIALKGHIDEADKEMGLKDKSFTETIKQMDEEKRDNKQTIQEYENLIRKIIDSGKEATFGNDYKIPKKVFDEITAAINKKDSDKEKKENSNNGKE